MKTKRKQIPLFAGVILIWSAIGYQLYSIIAPVDPIVSKNELITPLADTTSLQTYELVANYRDPFLKENRSQLSNKQIPGKSQILHPAINKSLSEPINWDILKFLGTVENEDTKDRVALVSFQGKMMMLKKNDVIQAFSIIKVFKDSIQVSNSNQKRTIIKSGK